MESRFSHDFSQVRIHTDALAAQSADAVNALAYTVGGDVVFGAGQYAPSSMEGQHLLAHELTHVVQQSARTHVALHMSSVSDFADAEELAADTIAEQVLAGGRNSVSTLNAVGAPPRGSRSQASLPVPWWNQLPSDVQTKLGWCDLDEQRFNSLPDLKRQTVLNLFVKLSGLDLWKYVGEFVNKPDVGNLDFVCFNVPGLMNALRAMGTFTDPGENQDTMWDSREKRGRAPLHIKHFAGTETIQAHIDRYGLYLNTHWYSTIPGFVAHTADWFVDGYQEALDVRDILLKQGWYRDALIGIVPGLIQRQVLPSPATRALQRQRAMREEQQLDATAESIIKQASGTGSFEKRAVDAVWNILRTYYPDQASKVSEVVWDESDPGLSTSPIGTGSSLQGRIHVGTAFITGVDKDHLARRVLQVGHELQHVDQQRAGMGGAPNRSKREFLAFAWEALAKALPHTGRMRPDERLQMVDCALGFYYCLSPKALSKEEQVQCASQRDALLQRRKELMTHFSSMGPKDPPTSCIDCEPKKLK
jgi:hypothetical protein